MINSISKKLVISVGSTCAIQMVDLSHVLLALGLNEDQTHESIRIGYGRFNTNEDIEVAIKGMYSGVKSLIKIHV